VPNQQKRTPSDCFWRYCPLG